MGRLMLPDLAPAVQQALAQADTRGGVLLEQVIRIASIPAPTFHEEERAAYVEAELKAAGLTQVGSDDLHDVWGLLPGDDHTRALLVEAHMDTVFGPDVDVRPRLEGDVLFGPGVRDNS